MSLDFALKDFYRKKEQTYPYLFTIILVVALSIFSVYLTISINLGTMSQKTLFSGAITLVYTQFYNLILILILILSTVIVLIVLISLILSKKKDIAIMKALGTLPEYLYGFYLIEVYIIFLIGFAIGSLIGFLIYGIFYVLLSFFPIQLIFTIDILYIPLFLLACLIGIFLIPGQFLRKIGSEKVSRALSKDIKHNYNASKKLTVIPRWLISLGYNLKMAVINSIRQKARFLRYLVVFSLIILTIFTLGLGSIVINSSSQAWIRKSQGENVLAIGHKDVTSNYSMMYQMFSDSQIAVQENSLNFGQEKYFFNESDLNELNDIEQISKVDKRIIRFCDLKELRGIIYYEEGGYQRVGKQRAGSYPIMGVNSDNLIPNFEIEGRFFDETDYYYNMCVGDGLAYNFFDYALSQSLELESFNKIFHISGVVVDSFYNGYAGYVDLDEFQEVINVSSDSVNIVLVQYSGELSELENRLTPIIQKTLGDDFKIMALDGIFQDNVNALRSLMVYPLFMIFIISIIGIYSLFNYQKAGLAEKIRDFSIIRAVGAKYRSIRRILFFESLFILVPSSLISLAMGMIVNSIILVDPISLPPIYVPFVMMGVILVIFLAFHLIGLRSILKKIKNYSIKGFTLP